MRAGEDLLIEVFKAFPKLPAHARKAFVTAFLLAAQQSDHADLLALLGNGIRNNRITADDSAVQRIYRTLPRALRIQLVGSFAGSSIGARAFKRLFEDALFNCRPSRAERIKLARSMSRFFALHPRASADALKRAIRTLLRSGDSELMLHALLVIDRLKNIDPGTLRIVIESVKSRSEGVRTNAWLALSNIARTPRKLRRSQILELRDIARASLVRSNAPPNRNPEMFLQVTNELAGR
jgi:hypothetical protein